MKSKRTTYTISGLIAIVSILVIASIAVAINNTKNKDIVVNVSLPASGVEGGATEYEVIGADSITDANVAIIKKVYSGDEYFRAITDQEAYNLASIITADRCGKITKSFLASPPVEGATNWTNFIDERSNVIDVYLLDDEYKVRTECR